MRATSRISLLQEVDPRPRAVVLFSLATAICALFLWLGRWVSIHGEPPVLWRLDETMRGHALATAWALTHAGWGYVLGPLYAALLLVAIVSRRWRVPALLAVASGLACWGAADLCQHFFARPRRADWLIKHETSFSYPSSHAAISTGFYFLCGLLVLRSPIRGAIRWPVFGILTVFTAAIVWSRLALAAHYVTDVTGGVLLASAVMLYSSAVLHAAGVRTGPRE